MCYAYEQEYWLRRAEEIRREMKKTEERLKQPPAPAAPAKPATPDAGVEAEPQPVPA